MGRWRVRLCLSLARRLTVLRVRSMGQYPLLTVNERKALAAEWIVQQARDHRIDGALVLRPRSMKPAAAGRLFIERALEEAGIPVLPIEADVVDARAWDPDAARASVRAFLETRVPA